MQSTNGTWVNGRRIEEVALKANDKVRAGTTVWVFETEAPQEEATIISGSS